MKIELIKELAEIFEEIGKEVAFYDKDFTQIFYNLLYGFHKFFIELPTEGILSSFTSKEINELLDKNKELLKKIKEDKRVIYENETLHLLKEDADFIYMLSGQYISNLIERYAEKLPTKKFTKGRLY